MISIAPVRARAAAMRRRPPLRHRLTGVEREIEKRLLQQAGVAAHRRQVGRALDPDLDVATCSPRPMMTGMQLVDERRERDRLQLQVLGPRELQEALHDLVEPPHLRGDDRDVLERAGRVGELHLQQLEVDHRRVERILDLVRDAGRQPAERRELARVARASTRPG